MPPSEGRLRALFVTPDFPPAWGGIQLLVHRLATAAPGLEPTVVTIRCEGADEADLDGLDVRRTGSSRAPHRLNLAALNAAALMTGVRQRFDVVVCAHIVAAPAAATIARLRGVPMVLLLYALEIPSRPSLTRWACDRADRVVAISRYTRELAVGVGAGQDKIAIITPGVDVGKPPRIGAGERTPTIVTVSRLVDRYKGHDVMLRAMPLVRAAVPEARLAVLGDGRLQPHLESMAESLGLTASVTFTGEVATGERDAWLSRARVLAMPSRIPPDGAGEGFGIVYLEAGAHRAPVVAGAIGGALDAVVDGESGTLVDPTDHVAVAEALVLILTDDELATRLGDGGRARAERFSWPAAAGQLEALARYLVDER